MVDRTDYHQYNNNGSDLLAGTPETDVVVRGSKSGIFSFDDAGVPSFENRGSPIMIIINVLLNRLAIFVAWVEMDVPMGQVEN